MVLRANIRHSGVSCPPRRAFLLFVIICGTCLLEGAAGDRRGCARVTIKQKMHTSDELGNSVFQLGQILRKFVVVFLYLQRKFTTMAQDNTRHDACFRLNLVECGKNENRSLPHSRFGLANHIHAEKRLGNAFVLHCRDIKSIGILLQRGNRENSNIHLMQKVRRNKPSEGCSKPESATAFNNSGLSRNSLKPAAYIAV